MTEQNQDYTERIRSYIEQRHKEHKFSRETASFLLKCLDEDKLTTKKDADDWIEAIEYHIHSEGGHFAE